MAGITLLPKSRLRECLPVNSLGSENKVKLFWRFCSCLLDKEIMPTALKTAVLVGSILFAINQGPALAKGEMNRGRWLSAALTYVVPYFVNAHGQCVNRSEQDS